MGYFDFCVFDYDHLFSAKNDFSITDLFFRLWKIGYRENRLWPKKSVLRFPWSGFSVRCLSVRNPGFWLSRFCPDFSKKILSDVFLSRFCLSRFCPDFQKKNFPVSVCPDSVCLDSVRCPDFVRISRKNSVRCLSVRPGKDKTELSGLSLSLSADVWYHIGSLYHWFQGKIFSNLTIFYDLCCQVIF